jgi:hypothetical protein
VIYRLSIFLAVVFLWESVAEDHLYFEDQLHLTEILFHFIIILKIFFDKGNILISRRYQVHPASATTRLHTAKKIKRKEKNPPK